VPKPERLRLTAQEIPVKKIIALAALTFLLTIGTAAVLTVHPQAAMACTTPSCT
jgi:hypothetical protein